MTDAPIIWIGRHRRCGAVRRFETPRLDLGGIDFGDRTAYGRRIGEVRFNHVPVIVDCACGLPMYVAPVIGKRSEKACGATCQNARGPSCECSCVGANHGKSYG